MEGNRISVNTAKTLHNPVEVEINGTVYQVRINKAVFEQISKYEKKLREIKGPTDSQPAYESVFILYDQVEIMTGAPREEVEKVDFLDLRAICEFVMNKYYGKVVPAEAEDAKPKPPVSPEQAEKNGSGAGGSPSLS